MPTTNGNLGKLSAFDVKTMRELWSVTQRAAFQTAALTTASQVARSSMNRNVPLLE